MHEYREIKVYRGDALRVEIQVFNDEDPPRPIDLAYSVAVFSVHHGDGLTSDYGTPILPDGSKSIIRSSYGGEGSLGGIEWTDPRNGVLSVAIRSEDTQDLAHVPLMWSLRVWRPLSEEPLLSNGEVKTIPGGNTVMGYGTTFKDLLGVGWNSMVPNKVYPSWIMLLPAPGTDPSSCPEGPTYPVVIDKVVSDNIVELRDPFPVPPYDSALDRVGFKVLPAASSIVASGRFVVHAATVR